MDTFLSKRRHASTEFRASLRANVSRHSFGYMLGVLFVTESMLIPKMGGSYFLSMSLWLQLSTSGF